MKFSLYYTQFILFSIIFTTVSAKFSAESCSESLETCIEPGDTLPCNDNGDCVCGKCKCNSTVARYYGRFCEKCQICRGRCEELKDCVQCRVHGTGNFKNLLRHCNKGCAKYPEPELEDEVDNEKILDEKYCAFTDHSDGYGCRFYFLYDYDDFGQLYIRAQRTKDCPPYVSMVWRISGVTKLGKSGCLSYFCIFLHFLVNVHAKFGLKINV